ncbi:hypothetical protein D3C84_752430 [compost metagenome]
MGFQTRLAVIDIQGPIRCFEVSEEASIFYQHGTGKPIDGKDLSTRRIVMTDQLPALVVFGESRSGISVAQAFHHTRSLPRGLFRDGDGPLLGVKLGVTLTASCIPERER